MTTPVELIAAKRDGIALSHEQIHELVRAFSSGVMTDYQMAAFLMAVRLRGMTDDETVALTHAMLHSGQIIDLSQVPGIKVDKHSTGGVGDKVSIALVPIVAACGVPVPMVSGRGLGHTGGTLDKLEAIPGLRVDIPSSRFVEIVRDVGGCMIGQTAEIAPADKRMYALRDVTATVESIPLIVASILSKKLAEGIDALVLDVKVGRGAFMQDLPSARALASALVRVGNMAGKQVVALLTRMDAPLGRTIGNALETREAIELLHGHAPSDLLECTRALAVEMLLLGRVARDEREALERVDDVLRTGRALSVLERMIAAQHGDPSVVADPAGRLPRAPVQVRVVSDSVGWVHRIDALELALCAAALGAARVRVDDHIDPAVGIVIDAHLGDNVRIGDSLASIHARSDSDAARVGDRIRRAFLLGSCAPSPSPLILERLTGGRHSEPARSPMTAHVSSAAVPSTTPDPLTAPLLASLGGLVGGVVHEINNPATFIALAAGQIEKAATSLDPSPQADQIRHFASGIVESTRSLREIVANLGLLASGARSANIVTVELERLVAAACSLTQAAHRHDITIDQEVASLPTAPGRFAPLGPALVAVLSHAMQSQPTAGSPPIVRLRAQCTGDVLHVTVTFADAGIPAEPPASSSEPFHSTPAGHTLKKLGLMTVARQVVERLGGCFRLRSEADRCTTVQIEVPLEDHAARA